MQIKIYISFLITALFLCVPHTRAQEIEVPITLNEHGTQLRDVLRKIEQQSPYLFLYNETQLDMKQKINEKITSPDIRKYPRNGSYPGRSTIPSKASKG